MFFYELTRYYAFNYRHNTTSSDKQNNLINSLKFVRRAPTSSVKNERSKNGFKLHSGISIINNDARHCHVGTQQSEYRISHDDDDISDGMLRIHHKFSNAEKFPSHDGMHMFSFIKMLRFMARPLCQRRHFSPTQPLWMQLMRSLINSTFMRWVFFNALRR